MTCKWALLLAGGLLIPAAAAADGPPLAVRDLTGSLHIHQPLPFPCPALDRDVRVTGGGLEITPAEGLDAGGGSLRFLLTRGTVEFDPFTLHVSCLLHDETKAYTELSIQVSTAVSFTGTPAGSGAYTFTIPKEDVLLYEAAIVNGASESGHVNPQEPVTGGLDTVDRTLTLRVVMATRIHVDVLGDFDGTLTAEIKGTLVYPDQDGDGVPDREDNCPFGANPDQKEVVPPLLRPPAEITLAGCLDPRLGTPLAADVCEGRPVTVRNNAQGPFPLKTTVVTWSAEDAHGHFEFATQQVTVVDTTPPTFTFVPADVTVGGCGPVDIGSAIAVDDCAGPPAVTSDAPARFGPGTTPVKWTATDLSGNRATAKQFVTVVDVTPPTVACLPVGGPKDGGVFRVMTADACKATLRLGPFVLASGETIRITRVSLPGVRLVADPGPDGRRRFEVGPGENVITSTDESGNTAPAACQ